MQGAVAQPEAGLALHPAAQRLLGQSARPPPRPPDPLAFQPGSVWARVCSRGRTSTPAPACGLIAGPAAGGHPSTPLAVTLPPATPALNCLRLGSPPLGASCRSAGSRSRALHLPGRPVAIDPPESTSLRGTPSGSAVDRTEPGADLAAAPAHPPTLWPVRQKMRLSWPRPACRARRRISFSP